MSTSLFVKNQTPFLLLLMVLLWTATACQKNEPEMVHIKGRIVTKGTGDPILMKGIKFGVYEAQPTTGFLTPQQHLLIDSFETDANGMFEHKIIRPEFLENLTVRQISTVPGYAKNPYSYALVGNLKSLEKVEQYKSIVFEFKLDNRNGTPFDAFSYYVPGSQISSYVGNEIHTAYFNSLAYTPVRILLANHQLDTQYTIDLFFETLDTARYTFLPELF